MVELLSSQFESVFTDEDQCGITLLQPPLLTRATMGELVNPRPAGGGAFERPPPSGFSRIAKNGGAQAPPGFHPPYPHLFRNFCENFGPRPCEVRSPGQVK